MMKKNDIVTLEITSLTGEGSGVGHCSEEGGMTVFVPLTAVGDVISCRIVKVMKSYAYGKAERIITPSSDRVDSGCPVYGKCGGCCFRHISYEAELRAKEDFVRDAFERIGHISADFLPIIGSDAVDGYRNKAQYPIGKNDAGEVVCGFFGSHSHRIVPCTDCRLQPKIFAEILKTITDFVRENHISVYDEKKHEGVLRHICLRRGHYSEEINVTLVARRRIPEFLPLARLLMERFGQVKGVVLSLNKDRTNVILGSEEIVLAGSAQITDTMCANKITISPKSFYQVNTPAAERLYGVAKEFAQPLGKTVLDLYCGAGTIGLSMADSAREIIGVEIVQSAVENARNNAAANGVENISFICGDAGQVTTRLVDLGKSADVVVVDPARKGCDMATLDNIVAFAPERIVMVSCNPATAARDCAALERKGYRTQKIQAVDLFPRTGNVECVSLLSRRGIEKTVGMECKFRFIVPNLTQ